MKLTYITSARMPTEKAHGVQISNTIRAFADEGVDVLFIGIKRWNTINEDVFDYYNIERSSVSVRHVAAWPDFPQTKLGFWMRMLTFSLNSIWKILSSKAEVFYSREPFPLLFLTMSKRKTVYEMHDFPETNHWFNKLLCRRATHLVVTNAWAREQCISRYGIRPEEILLAPNGFKATAYSNLPNKDEARRTIGLPTDAPIALYSGHLYSWKGAHVLAAAAAHLKEMKIVFVGGLQEDRKRLQQTYPAKNIIWVEHQKPEMIPTYLAAADVLVLPNVPETQHSTYSTSPIKLFEYLASGRPVVASRLPSIESIVSDDHVFFVEPGNSERLAEAVRVVLQNTDEATKRANAARLHVEQYSWQGRAKKVLAHLG